MVDRIKFIYLLVPLILIAGGYPAHLSANSYMLENPDDMLIGRLRSTRVKSKEDLLDIARRNGFGYQEIKLVNPWVDVWLPGEGQEIQLPSRFILPDAPRRGIVLNIPEMRLYYYPRTGKNKVQEVITHPLGIGRQGWSTPYIDTHIIEKKINPAWYPPESIRQEHEEAGDPLPKIVKAGPDNPLGAYAMRLGLPQYLIHGTNNPYGVGMRVSHGCIRLYPEDIESLFNKVPLKTPVTIINQPYKVGIHNQVIYLEAHPFLDEDANGDANDLGFVAGMIKKITGDRQYEIDWPVARQTIIRQAGIPVPIGILIPNIAQLSSGSGKGGQPDLRLGGRKE